MRSVRRPILVPYIMNTEVRNLNRLCFRSSRVAVTLSTRSGVQKAQVNAARRQLAQGVCCVNRQHSPGNKVPRSRAQFAGQQGSHPHAGFTVGSPVTVDGLRCCLGGKTQKSSASCAVSSVSPSCSRVRRAKGLSQLRRVFTRGRLTTASSGLGDGRRPHLPHQLAAHAER